MFGFKIVSEKKWKELQFLLQVQTETIMHASEALDNITSKVNEVYDKVVSSDDKTHS